MGSWGSTSTGTYKQRQELLENQEDETITEAITEEIVENPLEAEPEVEATTITETLAEEQIATEPEIDIPPKKGSFFGKLF